MWLLGLGVGAGVGRGVGTGVGRGVGAGVGLGVGPDTAGGCAGVLVFRSDGPFVVGASLKLGAAVLLGDAEGDGATPDALGPATKVVGAGVSPGATGVGLALMPAMVRMSAPARAATMAALPPSDTPAMVGGRAAAGVISATVKTGTRSKGRRRLLSQAGAECIFTRPTTE
jgi:hypothetical protein